MNFPFVFLQTFYRETIDASKMSKTMTLKSEQNLFMPNFSTKNSDDLDEETSSNNMSVISQWDKLPSADSEPDESFSEMKPTKNLITTSPAKKVIVVNQLKSQNEELKKPETWAKAVQGQKSVVPEVQGGQKSSKMPEKPTTLNSCDSDEKENVEIFVVKNLDNPITPANLVVDNEIVKDNDETIIIEEKVEKIKENSEDNDGPVWIIPTEENKTKKRKKKKKPVKDD